MSKTKVSVVVPVYNVEAYVSQCLDSILTQTLKDIEVICVDDCSPDRSSEIILEYANRDSRVHYYKLPENRGPGPARNFGLDKVSGDYIAFMDPDDYYYSPESLQTLYENALSHDVDVSGGNIFCFIDEGIQVTEIWDEIKFEANGVFDYEDYHYPAGYWRFIYKTALIRDNHIIFPDYRYRQDPVFFVAVMSRVKKYYATTLPVYCYRLEHKPTCWKEEKITGAIKSFKDCFKIYEKEGYYNHLARDLSDLVLYAKIARDMRIRSAIRDINTIMRDVPFKKLASMELKYKIPTKRKLKGSPNFLCIASNENLRRIGIPFLLEFVTHKKQSYKQKSIRCCSIDVFSSTKNGGRRIKKFFYIPIYIKNSKTFK